MKTSQGFLSNAKHSKPTQPQTTTSKPFIEQSNTLSLKFQDLRSLMKKKQAQYQSQLLIEQAERVHNFLSQVQEQQKQDSKQREKTNKARLRREAAQYRTKAIQQFQKQWDQRFAKTVQQLEQIQDLLQMQQQQEKQKAIQEIQEAKNGKGLDKIKFSKKTLELQDQLRRLAKSQRYDEAHVVKSRWQKARKSQMVQFIASSVDRSRKSLEKLKKKHEKQKDLVADRLTQLYLKQKSSYEKQYDQLLKNAKTYQTDLHKIESKIGKLQRQKNVSDSKSRCSSFSFGFSIGNISRQQKKIAKFNQKLTISPKGQEKQKQSQKEAQNDQEAKIQTSAKKQIDDSIN